MEGWRHAYASTADAYLRAEVGKKSQCHLGGLRPADVLTQDRREMDALRRDRPVARMGSAPDNEVELRAGARRAGFCEVVRGREKARLSCRKPLHTRDRAHRVAGQGEKDSRLESGPLRFGRQTAGQSGEERRADGDDHAYSNGHSATAHLGVSGDRLRQQSGMERYSLSSVY